MESTENRIAIAIKTYSRGGSIQDTPVAARGKGWLEARAIKGVGRWYARKRRHRSMSRKMEGYKRDGDGGGGKGGNRERRDSRVPMPTHRRARL